MSLCGVENGQIILTSDQLHVRSIFIRPGGPVCWRQTDALIGWVGVGGGGGGCEYSYIVRLISFKISCFEGLFTRYNFVGSDCVGSSRTNCWVVVLSFGSNKIGSYEQTFTVHFKRNYSEYINTNTCMFTPPPPQLKL